MEFACIRDKGVADVTDRREKNVKQCREKLLDGKHLKTHISVNY
jgi:hypothetical protein